MNESDNCPTSPSSLRGGPGWGLRPHSEIKQGRPLSSTGKSLFSRWRGAARLHANPSDTGEGTWAFMKLALILAVFSACAAQAQTAPSPILVQNAWARATAPMAKTGAVYLTIVDHGAPDRLVSLSTPVAQQAQLHQTTMHDHIMRMRPVDGLAIAGPGPVTFAPGGYHVMLLGLKKALVKGDSFPLSLTFQHAGTLQVSVTVESVGAGGPVQDSGMGHDMDMKMPMTPEHK